MVGRGRWTSERVGCAVSAAGCLQLAYIPAGESTRGINRRGSCTVDPVLG